MGWPIACSERFAVYLAPPAMLGDIPGIQDVQMTTNGVTLARKLPQLKAAGLSGVNVSLDTLQSAKFQFISRRKGLDKVINAIEEAVTMEMDHVKVGLFSSQTVRLHHR